jgi:capsular exopolysaccharide synthesis family protein
MNDESSEAKLHALDYWQIIRNRYGVVLLAFFLVFMTVCVVVYILPRKYEGRVQLEIARDEKPVEMGMNRVGVWGDREMNFIQTQFKIITSYETLGLVADKLNLIQRWGRTKTEVIEELLDSIDPEEVRGTDLIDIAVYRQDPEEAAEIANTVATAYQERRFEFAEEQARESMRSLDQELQAHSAEVEKARVRMLDLAKKYKIVDLNPGTSMLSRFDDGVPLTTDIGIFARAADEMFTAEKEIETVRNNISALTGKTGDELIEQAYSLNLPELSLQTVYPQYLQIKSQAAGLRSGGLGPRHPDVQAIDAQLAKMREQLESGVEALKGALTTQLAIANQNFEKLRELKEDKAGESMDARSANVEYAEAKKDYMAKKELESTMYQTFLEEKVDKAIKATPIKIHQSAEPATRPAKPKVALLLGIGAIVGLGFGLGLAFFLEYLDTSVKSLEDVERYLEVPVLAVIPKDVGILHKQSGISPDAEAYRILRTNIEFNRKSADANAITVVSGGAGEGKSTTLVNLAFVCAQGGYNTLMIDGDLRRPKLHTFFDINNSVGLTNYLTTELALEDVILQTPIDNLYFMPSGILPADAAGILNSRRMSELIADVKSRFDLVLIDSPPILGVSDASVLASEVDLTMIVIQHRKLPRSMLLRVKQAVENVGGNLLGVVLNNVDVRSDSQYQYYTSYYTYYSPSNTAASRIEPAPAPSKPAKAAKAPTAAKAPAAPAPGSGDDAY